VSTTFQIPGSTVEVRVHESKYAPGFWSYILIDERGASIAFDAVDFSGLNVTAEQVSRIAFLLEVEHAS